MNITNWFTGVVEDIADPMELGRVRVRCFTYHNPNKNDIPTQDLPWSICILPTTSASIAGIGLSSTGLMPGSWVFGFFRDGQELQEPVVLGTFPSSGAPSEGSSGFNDPHGIYPLTAGNDISGGVTTAGFSTDPAFINQAKDTANFNSVIVGSGTTAETLHGPVMPVQVNGSVGSIIAVGMNEIGVRETSNNQGPGIQKYWGATDYKGGYGDRQPWCAAFVSWCVQQSGIFSEADRPKSASAFKGGGYEAWARSKAPKVILTVKPPRIRAGDLVIFGFSHIGIAISDSDASGTFRTVEGNTNAAGSREGNGVWEKKRSISLVRSAVTITQ